MEERGIVRFCFSTEYFAIHEISQEKFSQDIAPQENQ
jgi:hypothetical protein